MGIQTFIDYRMLDSEEWHIVELTNDEYFDREVDLEITYNAVPKFNQAFDYIDVDKSLLQNTRIRIIDTDNELSRTIMTTLWNEGENQIVERFDEGTTQSSYMMILTNRIQKCPTIWEIMRFQRKDNLLTMKFHSFIQEDEHGFQSEKIIFPTNKQSSAE